MHAPHCFVRATANRYILAGLGSIPLPLSRQANLAQAVVDGLRFEAKTLEGRTSETTVKSFLVNFVFNFRRIKRISEFRSRRERLKLLKAFKLNQVTSKSPM